MTDDRPFAELTAGQGLCRSCGLCCDGTICATVILSANDLAEPLEDAGVRIDRTPDGASFSLPWACLAGKSCGIYAARPQPCRTFRCKLLFDLESGAKSEAEAAAIVARAVRWRDDLLATLEPGSLAPTRTLNAIVRDSPRGAEVAVSFGALRAWLVKHFGSSAAKR